MSDQEEQSMSDVLHRVDDPIHVTRAFLPELEEYQEYVAQIFQSGTITNFGPLVKELERALCDKLQVANTLFVGNGTLALQLAIKALDLKGEIITTPYSYVATTSSILWENCTPVFTDILSNTFCLDPDKIEERITQNTSAILATHVYGVPCDVKKIQKIADEHGLKVIYDGAHAFGTKFNGRSLLMHGDLSTASFHATKLYHTVEGGAVFCKDEKMFEKLKLMRSFGHIGDDHISLGINAKNSEFHAAMGLCNLRHVDEIMAKRKEQWLQYQERLEGREMELLEIPKGTEYNYAYFPIVFQNGSQMSRVFKTLAQDQIFPRRYFYPSLNKLKYLNSEDVCPISERMANTVICVPLFHDLRFDQIDRICNLILDVISSR